jgi:hypothetical protein
LIGGFSGGGRGLLSTSQKEDETTTWIVVAVVVVVLLGLAAACYKMYPGEGNGDGGGRVRRTASYVDLTRETKSKKVDGGTYTGQWRGTTFDGLGTFVYDDGERYEGEWVRGAKHGAGKNVWPDGDGYDGAWFEDCKQGQGSYTYADGRVYTGGWFKDKMQGEGKISLPNGEVTACLHDRGVRREEGSPKVKHEKVGGKAINADGSINPKHIPWSELDG